MIKIFISQITKTLIVAGLLFFSGNYLFAQTTYPYARPGRTTLLFALKAKNPDYEHPRLFARSADFDTIRKKIVSDPQMKSWFEDILKTANKIVTIDKLPSVYEPIYVSPPISRSVPTFQLDPQCLLHLSNNVCPL